MPHTTTRDHPPRGEAQTQGHTGTHTQKPASGDNGGWKDTTGGDADERRRRRRGDQVLEQLPATDTLKDNLRVVSPHINVFGKFPKGFSRAEQGWGLQRKLHRSAALQGYLHTLGITTTDRQPQGHRSERHRECSRATQHRRLRQLGGAAVRQRIAQVGA